MHMHVGANSTTPRGQIISQGKKKYHNENVEEGKCTVDCLGVRPLSMHPVKHRNASVCIFPVIQKIHYLNQQTLQTCHLC